MKIIPFSTLDSPCPYLSDRASRTEYHYIINCDFAHNSNLVRHGFRRFGRYFKSQFVLAVMSAKVFESIHLTLNLASLIGEFIAKTKKQKFYILARF